MAAFTDPPRDELDALVDAAALGKVHEILPIAGGSVNSNFTLLTVAGRFFLRIYEEQDERGADSELAMVGTLAGRGVATPRALRRGFLAQKPAAIFPWVDADIVCQRGVTPDHARAVGVALAGVHRAGEGVDAPLHRFSPWALRARLERIDATAYPVARLRSELDAIESARDPSVAQGLAHGDLFRDNVLWVRAERRIAALLDFESAFRGPLVYDLAVTVLAWCYGDAFEPALASALVTGYESARPLGPDEKRALYTEARLAAVRFAITRITDYAMKGGEGRVMKDWRRFEARLDALDAMGARGFSTLVGLESVRPSSIRP